MRSGRELVRNDRALRACPSTPLALARGFHRALAHGTAEVVDALCEIHNVDTVVLSGGVMQNELFLSDLTAALSLRTLRIWTNREVPPNDGGISLGQAALAARSWCAPV